MDPSLDPSDQKCPACYSGEPASAELHLPKIREPALVVQLMADSRAFPSDAKILFGLLGSEDEQLELIPGAHYLETDRRDREHVADLIAGWIRRRAN